MKLHEDEGFRKASSLVRGVATGYCLWQEGDDVRFFAEAWMVAGVIVLVTAKSCHNQSPIVEVWRPVVQSITWADLSKALSDLAEGD